MFWIRYYLNFFFYCLPFLIFATWLDLHCQMWSVFLRVWWMGDRDHKLSWSQIHHLHPHSYTNDGGTSKDQWSVGWTQLRIRRWSREHETHSKKTRGKKRYQILVFQIHRRHWPNCFTRPLEESRSVRTTMNKNLKIMKSANSIRHFVCR